MESVFLHLLNMSITAGWLVLAVLVLRLIFRRAPKWIHCLLWVLVAVRLICPFSLESALSLIPSAETVPVESFLYETPSIHSGVPMVDTAVNSVLTNNFTPEPMNSVNPMQVVSILASYLWVAGMVAMVLYAVISTLRLRRRVREAAYVRENIWQCDRIATPFILGVFRPRIYLPTLLWSAEAQSVIAHEQAHLQRRDHWWKPLGFLLLTVYWFNPLLWLGYICLCRDIEAACDQRVVGAMDEDGRREYSRVLLACSAPRRLVTACPLAFGETGVKSRIKAVLNYKKPAFWLILVALVAVIVAAVCLLTNPRSTISDELDAFISRSILEEYPGEHTGKAYPTESHTVFGTKRHGKNILVYSMVLYEEYYQDAEGNLQVQSGSHIPTIFKVKEPEKGIYWLVDIWTPGDGAYHIKDVREHFPMRYWGKALDTAGYYAKHSAANLNKAKIHFAVLEPVPFKNLHTFSQMNWLSRKKMDQLYASVSGDRAEWHPVLAIKSRAELDAFIEEYKTDFQLDKAEGDGLTPIHQLSHYDDAYFAENTLLAVYYHHGSCSVQPRIAGVTRSAQGDILTMQLSVHKPEVFATALGQWFMLCQVDRAVTEPVTGYFGVAVETTTTTSGATQPSTTTTVLQGEVTLVNIRDTNPGAPADDALELFYSDDAYDYYFPQIISHRLKAVFSDGSERPLVEALLQGQVTLQDLGKFSIHYLCEEKPIPPQGEYGPNTFTGRVIRVSDAGDMLMECYDKDKFNTVWVTFSESLDIGRPEVGQEYVVTHTGQVMETFPPRVVAVKITRVSSTPLAD